MTRLCIRYDISVADIVADIMVGILYVLLLNNAFHNVYCDVKRHNRNVDIPSNINIQKV